VLGDVRFRRALVHSIDRQEMVDTLFAGMSPVPNSFLDPNQSEFGEIDRGVPRIDFDPRRASELLQELGYIPGPDGINREVGVQRIEIEVRTGAIEEQAKMGSAIAAYWQRLGLNATAARMPPQRAQDLEYVATFPGFYIRGGPSGSPRSLHSTSAPLPSNNFRAGVNASRYLSPELDEVIDTYFRTVPRIERTELLRKMAHHVADQVTLVGLAYQVPPAAIANRLINVSPQWANYFITWNAHEWDVT
jgi:peptide/nickel transport system substrate-binding protein